MIIIDFNEHLINLLSFL